MTSTSLATGAYAAAQTFLQAGAGSLGAAGAAAAPTGFESMLQGTIGAMTESGHRAEAQISAAASGKGDLVNVVTAVAETETALQTLVAVRDRVIAAYEEIMRMQI